MQQLGIHKEWERERLSRVENKITIQKIWFNAQYIQCAYKALYIQALTMGWHKYWQVLECSLIEPDTNSANKIPIYWNRNIDP